MTKLTHLDDSGAARMVDVSDKDVTAREASAEAVVVLSAEAFAAIVSGEAPKGDVIATARLAGIMAAKKTSELIPLCHQVALAKISVDIEPLAERSALHIAATAKTASQTGVEMEALTAVSIAALTIYDMVKALDRGATIETVRLLAKSGGKSGAYMASHRAAPNRISKASPRGAVLMNEATSLQAKGNPNAEREAFRAFMAERRLRATEWAKLAQVPAAQIFAYLTGRSRALPHETAEQLAHAARVRVEDMFAARTKPR